MKFGLINLLILLNLSCALPVVERNTSGQRSREVPRKLFNGEKKWPFFSFLMNPPMEVRT